MRIGIGTQVIQLGAEDRVLLGWGGTDLGQLLDLRLGLAWSVAVQLFVSIVRKYHAKAYRTNPVGLQLVVVLAGQRLGHRRIHKRDLWDGGLETVNEGVGVSGTISATRLYGDLVTHRDAFKTTVTAPSRWVATNAVTHRGEL